MIDFIRMRWLIKQAPRMAFEVEKAETQATVSGVMYSDMPKGASAGDKLERDAIRLAEVREAYGEVIKELREMQAELRPYVDALEDPGQRAVMRLRYFGGHSPEKIASSQMVPMARMSVYRALRKAENAIMLVLNGT